MDHFRFSFTAPTCRRRRASGRPRELYGRSEKYSKALECVLCAGAVFFFSSFDVESCPEEMTKCGGKRGRSREGGSKQLKCLTGRQAPKARFPSDGRPPLLLVAVMIAWLTDWLFEGRRDYVQRQIPYDKFSPQTDVLQSS